jgi:hypothetical protein
MQQLILELGVVLNLICYCKFLDKNSGEQARKINQIFQI